MELPMDKAAPRSTPLALPAGAAPAVAHQSPASLPLGHPAAASAKPLVASASPPLLPVQAAPPKSSSGAVEESKEAVEESNVLTIGSIRSALVKQDTIIFGLLERSQFCYNPDTYDPNASQFKFFFMQMLIMRLVLHPAAANININKKIWDVYFDDLLPRLVNEGSDGNCGSSACCDMLILQALSKRIHYGKFVAEAKFRGSPDKYTPAIINKDSEKLMELLTFAKVEEDVRVRVMTKAVTFGQVLCPEADPAIDTKLKIEPELAVELYDKWIMPLTKEVQVQYLLRRLD